MVRLRQSRCPLPVLRRPGGLRPPAPPLPRSRRRRPESQPPRPRRRRPLPPRLHRLRPRTPRRLTSSPWPSRPPSRAQRRRRARLSPPAPLSPKANWPPSAKAKPTPRPSERCVPGRPRPPLQRRPLPLPQLRRRLLLRQLRRPLPLRQLRRLLPLRQLRRLLPLRQLRRRPSLPRLRRAPRALDPHRTLLQPSRPPLRWKAGPRSRNPMNPLPRDLWRRRRVPRTKALARRCRLSRPVRTERSPAPRLPDPPASLRRPRGPLSRLKHPRPRSLRRQVGLVHRQACPPARSHPKAAEAPPGRCRHGPAVPRPPHTPVLRPAGRRL